MSTPAANTCPSAAVSLIATAAFGLEAVVGREIQALGYPSTTIQPGRLLIEADLAAICRLNIELRTAERVLICVGRFAADDFGLLFDGVQSLPWERWIPAHGQFPVSGRSIKSQLSSVPACQRIVKKAIVERLREAHGVQQLDEDGPCYGIEVALLNDQVTLTIDTSGAGLHKRGYRAVAGQAPLRETLAAALIQLSFWHADRPLIDPFCGAGTIPIEAALIGRKIAPGLHRQFAAEQWPLLSAELWMAARETAQSAILPELPVRILGLDQHEHTLRLARQNAEHASVAQDIHFQTKAFGELTSKQQYGCVITNPPYGQRQGEHREMEQLYRSFPVVLRRLPTWSHYVLTAFPNFEAVLGQQADRRRKLYNGRIECQYYQFHGPRPPKGRHAPKGQHAEAAHAAKTPPLRDKDVPGDTGTATVEDFHKLSAATAPPSPDVPFPTAPSPNPPSVPKDSVAPIPPFPAAPAVTLPAATAPVFGGLDQRARRQAEEFASRLKKRARHLRRWPSRGITCYRLYERDIPEVPLVVDRYEDRLHMAEFARPHDRTPAEHADWLDLMIRTAADVMEIHPAHVHMKYRDRQRGSSQYERRGSQGDSLVVREGGLKFLVNLSDYLDTGLFLDHRTTRRMFRETAAGRRVLNLFAYTGTFSVYAAAGGAVETTTVDLSHTYLDWYAKNMDLNGMDAGRHRRVPADVPTFVRDLHPDVMFDLAIVDPPTFSNSKSTSRDWEVQRDHADLLANVLRHISPGGIVFFSTNFRRIKFQEDAVNRLATVREISQQTVPEDFRNRRIHRTWKITANP